MRNLLALIGLVVVLFVGVGWYFKWYSFAMTPGVDGRQNINVQVDTKKIASDTKDFVKKAGTAIQSVQQDELPKSASPDFVGPHLPTESGIQTPTTLKAEPTSRTETPKMPYLISLPGPNG